MHQLSCARASGGSSNRSIFEPLDRRILLAAYIGATPYATIQLAAAAAAPGDTISVEAGVYDEDVVIATSGVSLVGAGADVTTIRGVIGGEGSTIKVSGDDVEITGFTITRTGNNATDWNDPGLNFAGIAVQGQATTGLNAHGNIITGNRTGIDINNSSGHMIANNQITANHTGMILRNQTDGLVVLENEITDNRTVGILFLDQSGGTNTPIQSADKSVFFSNDISGNWYGQVVDRQAGGSLPAPGTTNLKDFGGNWFGTAQPATSTANSAEPGYATHIPVEYGGTATAPGGQPDVLGPGVANLDITPLLATGIDTSADFGFQGDFSSLVVVADLAQIGTDGRIQEGVNMVTAGGTIDVAAGTYVEQVDIGKELTLAGVGDDTVIRSPASLAGYVQGANTYKAVVNVHGTNATLRDFKLDGDSSGNGDYSFAGVGYFDAGGAIDNLTVIGVHDNPASGTQHGNAILARNTAAVARTLTISDNRVSDYQKNGITVNDIAGDKITTHITDNTVTGEGPIGYIAQNGIQIYNVTGGSTVTGNTISGQDYTGAGWASAGMILDTVRAGTVVSGNTITTSMVGIYHVGGDATISGNTIAGTVWGVIGSTGALEISGNDFDDAADDNDVDIFIFGSTSLTISGNQFAGDVSFIESIWAGDIDATGNSFDEASNFRVEDKMYHALDDASVGLITWVAENVYVTTPGTGSTDSSIQAGIDAAGAGFTVNIEAGSYPQNVNVNKGVTLQGAGSGSSAGDTVVTAAGNVFSVTAADVTVQALRAHGGARGMLANSVSNLTLDDFAASGNTSNGLEISGTNQAVQILNSRFEGNVTGLRMGTGANLDGLTVADTTFDGNGMGITVYADSAGGTYLTNVEIRDTAFTNNAQKGAYFEKLSNALFDNILVKDSGTDAAYAFNNGIDINLKYDDYENITIQCSEFVGSGINTIDGPGGLDFAAALAIKARDDGSYAANPATLTGVTIQGNVFTDSAGNQMTTAIRLGEPGANAGAGNAGATGVVIAANELSDGTFTGVDNAAQAAVDARFNWWGSTDGATVASLVTGAGATDYFPFLLGAVADSLVFLGDGGEAMIVNSATGLFLFTAGTSVYEGTGARLENGVLKIHEQTTEGKVDAMGEEDGVLGISLKGGGKPRVYSMEAYSLFDCLTDDDDEGDGEGE